MKKILFVCTGNICRSPTAEAVFRNVVKEHKLEHSFAWDSAGTHGYHVGEAPDPRTIRTAAKHGIAMDDLRARKIRASDFMEFDLLLAMDEGHLAHLRQLAPNADAMQKLHLYLPYAGYETYNEVPDPYYDDQRAFDAVLEMIEQATIGLIARLQKDQ